MTSPIVLTVQSLYTRSSVKELSAVATPANPCLFSHRKMNRPAKMSVLSMETPFDIITTGLLRDTLFVYAQS